MSDLYKGLLFVGWFLAGWFALIVWRSWMAPHRVRWTMARAVRKGMVSPTEASVSMFLVAPNILTGVDRFDPSETAHFYSSLDQHGWSFLARKERSLLFEMLGTEKGYLFLKEVREACEARKVPFLPPMHVAEILARILGLAWRGASPSFLAKRKALPPFSPGPRVTEPLPHGPAGSTEEGTDFDRHARRVA